MLFAGCDDMLDVTPRDKFTNDQSFWNNKNQVENYTNNMYGNFVGYNTGGSTCAFYFSTLTDDQLYREFEDWTFTSVPSSSSSWYSPWTEIRRSNYLLDGMKGSSLDEADKAKYSAIARFARAYNYFLLIKKYGDVQWQDHVILNADPKDPEVQGARDDRDMVMDKVLEDIDYAISHLPAGGKFTWSPEMDLAYKSEVCLFEGTYCKYRTAAENGKAADPAGAQKYLTACVDASEKLMNKNYSLTEKYGEVYNSISLGSCSEIIFARQYNKDVLGHSVVDYTTGSTMTSGITKDAIDAFLFLDGKPLQTTTMNTSDLPKLVNGEYSIAEMLSVRDKRLSVLIDPILAFKGHGHSRDPKSLAEMTSSTGYTIAKYYTDKMGDASTQTYYCNNIGTAYTDAPIYWLAVIYLNYAEAKAELGSATQADLDKSVNKLQTRAGLPGIVVAPAPDPANKINLGNLLWEIRRARRCELMTDGNRYWDLVRWHQLDKLDTSRYPNLLLGANLSGVSDYDGTLDNGYMKMIDKTRTFNSKYYFYPIPQEQLNTNPNCKQNPGW